MALFFRFDDTNVCLDDLTLGESEEVDAIVNAGRDAKDRETWAVGRPTSSPVHVKAIARVCFARTDTANADQRASALTVSEAAAAIVNEDDTPLVDQVEATQSSPT